MRTPRTAWRRTRSPPGRSRCRSIRTPTASSRRTRTRRRGCAVRRAPRRLSSALAPASVRFEALSPFGQPFLLVTVHDGKITAYNAATNEARVGAANVETAADLLSLPVEPEDLVALLSGRVAPPRDLRVAEILPPDGLGRSVKL